MYGADTAGLFRIAYLRSHRLYLYSYTPYKTHILGNNKYLVSLVYLFTISTLLERYVEVLKDGGIDLILWLCRSSSLWRL